MSGRAVIDSVEFARNGEQLRGQRALSSFERLRDLLFDASGDLTWWMRGGRDAEQRLQLTVGAEGVLQLRCQRCLGALNHPLRFENGLLLGSGPQADAAINEPAAPEWIAPDAALDVDALVEDEILLALPYAPRHADGECSERSGPAVASTEKASPFAELAAWKRNQSNRNNRN